MSPWHNRIAQPPPKGQVTGSIPVGDTIFLFYHFQFLRSLKRWNEISAS